jgi:hypothetical protein
MLVPAVGWCKAAQFATAGTTLFATKNRTTLHSQAASAAPPEAFANVYGSLHPSFYGLRRRRDKFACP